MSDIPHINLLIVDDNLETCKILNDFFEMQKGFTVCGEAHNGADALIAIHEFQPDVVIMDIVMPGKDGINVLEEIHETPPEKIPAVIITSAIGEDLITKKAMSLGVGYFLMKPYSLDSILSRIKLITGCDESLNEYESLHKYADEEQIAKILLDLGVPTNMLGYRYTNIAFSILLSQKSAGALGKTVYSKIATDYKTTRDCAERAIRQVIKRVYASKTKLFCDIMNYGNRSMDKCPSNGVFLTLTTEYLKIEKKW